MTRNRLKDLREDAGLSVADLSAAARIPARSIYQYEAGSEPTLRRAKRLADALGVTLEDLLDEEAAA